MKIILITLPVRFARMPPIDLAYLSAYLEERGHEVYVRDLNLELPVCDDRVYNNGEPGSSSAQL